ncbi:MAG: hypothetical protein K0Q59_1258 [Paenibacillus sp.]|nr:hypothetical protein [Paenibacillus sp.]
MCFQMTSENAVASITDYQLEEYLRCPFKYYNKYILQKSTDHLNWKQLVQYAVNHAIYEFYTLPIESRSSSRIIDVLNRHWTNKVHRFESNPHFHRVKAKVIQSLLRELASDSSELPPLLLFENISVWIDELQSEMSMIFQLARWAKQSFIIQKFIVDEDRDVTTAFVHMASVLSSKAFQTLPERIEIITLMTGQKQVYRPKREDLPGSIAYMQITNDLFQETTVYKKSSSVQECVACPFMSDCRTDLDMITSPYIQ